VQTLRRIFCAPSSILFSILRAKEEPKKKTTTNSAPDPISLIAQKLDQMNTQFVQTQNQVMSRLTTLERNQSAPRHPFVRKEPTGWKEKPQQEEKAPDTLNPVGMVNLEELPWCSPCQEPHPEEECPRREEDSHDNINFMDTIFSFQDDDDDEPTDIT
jgi:hypothetical protein